MEIPTIEEVKEYFKNAKEIKFCNSKTIGELTTMNFKDNLSGGINEIDDKGYFIRTNSDYNCVWFKGKFAEIISYKDSEVTDSPIESESYDFINPNHYKSFSKEVIDMMVDIWGKEAVAIHCEITAFKYKMRAGSKPNQSIEQDISKANWYLNKAKELRNVS